MARRNRDFTVPRGRPRIFAISPWARPSTKGKLNDTDLLLRKFPKRATQPHIPLRIIEHFVRPLGFLGRDCFIDGDELLTLVAAQSIDPQVARHRVNPGCRTGASRIVLGGLAPNRDERLLRDVLGRFRRGARAHQHGFDPGRIEAKQRGKSRAVAVQGNGADALPGLRRRACLAAVAIAVIGHEFPVPEPAGATVRASQAKRRQRWWRHALKSLHARRYDRNRPLDLRLRDKKPFRAVIYAGQPVVTSGGRARECDPRPVPGQV